MSYLNLGVVAHVDAGKTSLTERLLFEAGAIDAPGRVDEGTTRTDSMDLERRRGITIRAAVTSLTLGDVHVTLVDTPGHPDFVAEVERTLAVLDAAVLVLSAVEGVQPQTVAVWRALRRVGVPTLLFVNKLDRAGADLDRVRAEVERRLTPRVVPLARATGQGASAVRVEGLRPTDPGVVEAVAEVDDTVLRCWAEGRPPGRRHVLGALRRGVREGALVPLLGGSAVTGAGVDLLCAALVDVVPAASRAPGPLAGTVFAVDRDRGARRAWVRLWSGEVAVRDRVAFAGRRPEVVTGVEVSTPGGVVEAASAGAGQVVALRGPSARIGEVVGTPPSRRTPRFAPPALQVLVAPEDPTRRTALFAGLAELADEDPLIGLHLDDHDEEAAVSLHGPVQAEVLLALLEARYGVRARVSGTSTVCLERVVGRGAAVDRLEVGDNPYLAGIGLRVQAGPVGSGVVFSPGVERGNLPPAFVAATEEGVRDALRQGPHGWRIDDCVVTMTESGYWPRQSRPHQKFDKSMSSVAADFRLLAPVVLAAALSRAGTVVCPPVDRFDLDVPDGAHGPVAALLGRLGAVVLEVSTAGGHTRLSGHLASSRVPEVAARLADLTGGEGVLLSEPDHHAPWSGPGPPPVRRRVGPDPADRTAWFRDRPR